MAAQPAKLELTESRDWESVRATGVRPHRGITRENRNLSLNSFIDRRER